MRVCMWYAISGVLFLSLATFFRYRKIAKDADVEGKVKKEKLFPSSEEAEQNKEIDVKKS